LIDFYELPGGVKIPCVGFGTWQVQNGPEAVSAVADALKCGYRHIDTAAGYGNEESVGIAIRNSGIAREDVFITSKLPNDMHGYENALLAFERTMENLKLDYLDLYLIHWPNPIKFRSSWEQANEGAWKAFEELHRAGRIRAIGISNFRPRHISALEKTASIKPMVNQIRLCPGDTQDSTTDFCKERGILLEAYSPLGSGKIFDVPQLKSLEKKYGKSAAQICVRWSLERGYLPLPKSKSLERIRENADVFDFSLSPEDIRLLADLKGCCGYAQDPDSITW
jgi:diketogulonate reductase-like aldo/keto reductase